MAGITLITLLAEKADSEIYRTSDNKRMIDWENTIKEMGKNEILYFRFWSTKLNASIFSVGDGKNVIFDVKQGKVIGEFPAYVIIGTNADGTLVAVRPCVEDYLSKVEIINLSEVVSKYQSGK